MRAQRLLNDARDLIYFAQHSAGLLSGSLRFGVIPSVAPYLLPPLLPLLRQHYPDLVLHLRETQTHHLTEELAEGKLDVLLLALPVKHPDIETLEIFQDRFLLALPKSKKLSGRVRATKELIEGDRLLLLEEGHCLRDQALTFCALQQVDMINTFGATSLATIVEMVSAGLGITLLPEICLGVETRNRDLKLFALPTPNHRASSVWHGGALSPRHEDFKALAGLVAEAGKLSLKRAAVNQSE